MNGREQGRLDAFGQSFLGGNTTGVVYDVVDAGGVVGDDVRVVGRLGEEENWQRMGATEDNERRMMLSRPSLVSCAPPFPSGVQSGFQRSSSVRQPFQRLLASSMVLFSDSRHATYIAQMQQHYDR